MSIFKKKTAEERMKARKSNWTLKKQYEDALFEYSQLKTVYAKKLDEVVPECKVDILHEYIAAKESLENKMKFLNEQMLLQSQNRTELGKSIANVALGTAEAATMAAVGWKSMQVDTDNEIANNRNSQNMFKTLVGVFGHKVR